MRATLVLSIAVFFGATAVAEAGNLLRNSAFQDDWLTLVPEVKNHHWCYSSEFYHRRDYNPDGWVCKGSWRWDDADAAWGRRKLIVMGPAQITQRVNWVLVHDARQMGNLADAGGFPAIVPQRSLAPERLVRDLSLRVRLRGRDVPEGAGVVEVAFCPPGGLTISDPFGTETPPIALAATPLPAGSFESRWIDVNLTAAQWLEAARGAAAKNAKEALEVAKAGLVLPGTIRVAIRYQAKAGEVELERAELSATEPEASNLQPNGSFEDGYPGGWGAPEKYRHFPGRLYYIFNTWHNGAADNRGSVGLDPLVYHGNDPAVRMVVPAGDEVALPCPVAILNQTEPRLLEVSAWVKTERLCMLNLEAVDENGERLDGHSFIHMAPYSVGTDEWRQIRQVFRPRQPLKQVRLRLCARGVNGYTLDDTGWQPQNNVVGTIWWSGVRMSEPETSRDELARRGARVAAAKVAPAPGWRLDELDLGERLQGSNVLSATVVAPHDVPRFRLTWELTSPTGQKSHFESPSAALSSGKPVSIKIPYTLTEPCSAYSEYRGTLTLHAEDKALHTYSTMLATWCTPLDLELGALYLQPEQKQFVRLNLGLAAPERAGLAKVRLEVVRRGTGAVLKTWEVPATPADIVAQRARIPSELRDDFTGLLLTDLDVGFLPLQPFGDPQRNWLVRAAALDQAGAVVAQVESPPFCRLAHPPPQPAIASVAIKNHVVHVNGAPWLPWGAVYGHVPVYAGPADPGAGKYLDLHNLPTWSMYDRFTAAPYTRARNDFNCMRYVAASITDPKVLEKLWQGDNLYCSSAFVVPHPVFSSADLAKEAKGADKLQAYLAFCRSAPMVVSTAPGIEEAFGTFTAANPAQLDGLAKVVNELRQGTGKPVMVGHGGYWNRLEFEKVPFFDIFDPETEPLYPANLHTDLRPLIKGENQAIWLRPQMYEDVPFERWRYHVFVELTRGCRGWQIAHGPGDQSLFRGLHGELEFFRPIIGSTDKGPEVRVEPWLEHWSRRHAGKTYVAAATTRGISFGRWRWDEADGRRCRVTVDPYALRDETNSYGADQKVPSGPTVHGIQYLPDARSWPAGTKVVQWVRLDPQAAPAGLVLLAKADGRWTHAAAWGKHDAAALRQDLKQAEWFLRTFYRHASGFLGWDSKLVSQALEYLPGATPSAGQLPKPGEWVKLELPLEQIGAAGKLLDGVGFLHNGGRVWWGRTSLVAPDGVESVVWGNSIELPPKTLARVKVHVAGIKAGTPVRVLFEDRELRAADGYFEDDFRGADLYQRFGGGYGVGYGNGPVALHLYEVAGP